jgi:cold shock protein
MSQIEQKLEGIIKFWKEEAGYGFIKQTDGTEIFFHATGLIDKVRKDDFVEFEVKEGKKGKNAINVKKI